MTTAMGTIVLPIELCLISESLRIVSQLKAEGGSPRLIKVVKSSASQICLCTRVA